jgi:hypothetical protein
MAACASLANTRVGIDHRLPGCTQAAAGQPAYGGGYPGHADGGQPRGSRRTAQQPHEAEGPPLSWRGIKAACRRLAAEVDHRLLMEGAQLVASLLFILLYVWSTYQPAIPGSWRYWLVSPACFCGGVFVGALSWGPPWRRMHLRNQRRPVQLC